MSDPVEDVAQAADCGDAESSANITTTAFVADEREGVNLKETVETNESLTEDVKSDLSDTTVTTPTATVASSDTENDAKNSSQLVESAIVDPKSVSTEFKMPAVPLEKAKAARSSTCDNNHAEHVTYNEHGTAIYTDPKTKYKYMWSEEKATWTPCQSELENEHYIWCDKENKWLPKSTQITETEHYKWDAEKNEWILKQQAQVQGQTKSGSESEADGVTYSVDEQGQRTYTDKDGVVFFWDEEKNAWFPKIDDDFMARYQMSYGFIDNVSASEEEKRKKEADEEKRKAEELEHMEAEARAAMEADSSATTATKRKAPQEPPKWFDMDPAHNTKVYVSNLPLDITLDEFGELMSKCGMIMRDQKTQKYKLKLYAEADGQIKGDGLCDYIKVESVNLALKILDESMYRGNKIRVQPAKFQMRGEYNPALKPKRRKKDKEKMLKMKERLFDWRPEKMRGERTKNEKIVIITNLFTPELFEQEVQLILDYQNDLREECSKCGTVRKVIIYDRHADGVAQVNMASPEEADLVIQMMHGRFFGKRKLSAEHWDGKTKYKVDESEQEVKDRLSNWDDYLEQGGNEET